MSIEATGVSPETPDDDAVIALAEVLDDIVTIKTVGRQPLSELEFYDVAKEVLDVLGQFGWRLTNDVA